MEHFWRHGVEFWHCHSIICVVLLKYRIDGGIVISSVPVSGVHISFIFLRFHNFGCSGNYQILLKTTSLDVCYFQYVYKMQTANFIHCNGWLHSLSWIFFYKMRVNVQTFYNHYCCESRLIFRCCA